MSVWNWYRALSSRTRILIGVGVMGYAGLGLFLSDKAEEAFDMVPTEQDKARLENLIPRVRLVNRDGRDKDQDE